MDPVLYNAMNGAHTEFKRQAIISHNMANINSVGFKADLFHAQSHFIHSDLEASEAVVVQGENNIDMTDGPLMTTNRDLDVAVQNKGWLAVQTDDGKEAYTRDGSLHINENGVLMNSADRPVMGDGGPISIPPSQSVEIGLDGTISIVPLDGPPGTVAMIDRLKLVKLDNEDVFKDVDGLVKLRKGGVAPTDANVSVVKGALEGSNVNSIDQMISMISAGQEFNAKMKVMQSVSDNHQKLAQLLQD